jgi:hypothetical protein
MRSLFHPAVQTLSLDQIHLVGDGLNIEGATIAQKYLKQNQIWANLCVVLDRPFLDGIEYDEIAKNNCYSLKEVSLLEYNEKQVNLAYVTTLYHYITKAHEIVKKVKHEEVKIIIKVHRSGPEQLDLLEKLLTKCYPELGGKKLEADGFCKYELFIYNFPQHNVQAHFCFGNKPEFLGELGKYNDKDIVLSFSLVAGFNPKLKAGSLLIPSSWIPLTLGNMELFVNKRYVVRNHLQESISEILMLQNERLLNAVNEFSSENPQKKHIARKLALDDFKEATLVQADGMFNPSKHPKFLKVL